MENNISKSIASGAIWSGFQMIGIKVFSMAGQLVLAWILLPEDFGKISLVYTLTSVGVVLQNFGLTDVLISRSKSFNLLVPLAKSITVVLACFIFILIIICAFIGGIIYRDTELTYLVLIFSLSVPFNTFSVVPDAKLRSGLEFKTLSIIRLYSAFLTPFLTVIFALCSFGAYSFVFPLVIVSVLKYFYLNYRAGIGLFFKITFRRWQHLVHNSMWGFVYAICQKVIQQFDFAVLGLFALQSEVGVYYLAFSLSIQAIGLLVGSVGPVLFPALNKVPKGNKIQLKSILLRIMIIMAMLGMPFAFWQAVSVEPLVLLFLPEKWYNTIELVRILSVGIGFQVVGSLWTVALRTKSDFRKQANFSILSSVYFLLLIIPLSYFYKSIGTAIGVAIFNISSNPFLIYASFKSYNFSFLEIIKPFIKYFFISLFIFGGIFFLSRNIKNFYINFSLNSIISPVIYIMAVFLIDKALLLEFFNKIKEMKNS